MRSFLERQKLSVESEKVICGHEGNEKAKEFLQKNLEYWAQVHTIDILIGFIYVHECFVLIFQLIFTGTE